MKFYTVPVFYLLLIPLLSLAIVDEANEKAVLDSIIADDDRTRERFKELKDEVEGHAIASDILSIVDRYAKLRRFQRALAVVEVAKPPVLPPPFYAFKLAMAEAKLLSCYQDFDKAIYILHLARDNLLKFLGPMSKDELANYMDVWRTVYAFTSKLITWYSRTGRDGEGVRGLMAWMIENGPYRSKSQLPEEYFPELPMEPWPTFEDWEGLGLVAVRDKVLRELPRLREEFKSEGMQNEMSISHDADCLLDNVKGEGYMKKVAFNADVCKQTSALADQFEGAAESERGEGEEEEEAEGGDAFSDPSKSEACNLMRSVLRGYKVHELSYNQMSGRAQSIGHFGRSNAIWNIIVPLDDSPCLKVVVHKSEALGGDIILFDDSFWTSYENVCDAPVSYVRLDLQHPQFR